MLCMAHHVKIRGYRFVPVTPFLLWLPYNAALLFKITRTRPWLAQRRPIRLRPDTFRLRSLFLYHPHRLRRSRSLPNSGSVSGSVNGHSSCCCFCGRHAALSAPDGFSRPNRSVQQAGFCAPSDHPPVRVPGLWMAHDATSGPATSFHVQRCESSQRPP